MDNIEAARTRIKELYEKRLHLRAEELRHKATALEVAAKAGLPVGDLRRGGIFDVKEDDVAHAPTLIQCCIR